MFLHITSKMSDTSEVSLSLKFTEYIEVFKGHS